jgi:hypothetical protein
MNCKKSVFVSFVISLTLLVVLGACNTSMFLPAASTDPIASKNLASTAEMSADTPPPANSPTITPTPTEFVVHVPTPTYTFTHFPALADGSDLQTATPITYFRHLPYIQILQDNQVVEPVHGVINLSYGPFVFRYVARPGFSMYVNFSLTDTFQNMAHDGFDPFLPCPNPFCQGNEYPLDGHVIAIDDNQYAELRYCRISLHSLPSDISKNIGFGIGAVNGAATAWITAPKYASTICGCFVFLPRKIRTHLGIQKIPIPSLYPTFVYMAIGFI